MENNSLSRESKLEDKEYKWGFTTDVETEVVPKGLSEEVIKLISKKKKEPDWLLDWRLKAYKHWLKQDEKEGEPEWAMVFNHSPLWLTFFFILFQPMLISLKSPI